MRQGFRRPLTTAATALTLALTGAGVAWACGPGYSGPGGGSTGSSGASGATGTTGTTAATVRRARVRHTRVLHARRHR